MNQTKKINFQEIEIKGKSDRLVVWNTEHYHCWQSLEKRGFDFQYETKEYSPETKRLWIYVNEPEKLLYITKIVPLKEKVSEKLWDCEKCRGMMRELNNNSIYKMIYKLELLHKFSKGNSLQEIQKYKHWKTGKYLFVPKPTRTFVYISSYPYLKSDIIIGKIS